MRRRTRKALGAGQLCAGALGQAGLGGKQLQAGGAKCCTGQPGPWGCSSALRHPDSWTQSPEGRSGF